MFHENRILSLLRSVGWIGRTVITTLLVSAFAATWVLVWALPLRARTTSKQQEVQGLSSELAGLHSQLDRLKKCEQTCKDCHKQLALWPVQERGERSSLDDVFAKLKARKLLCKQVLPTVAQHDSAARQHRLVISGKFEDVCLFFEDIAGSGLGITALQMQAYHKGRVVLTMSYGDE